MNRPLQDVRVCGTVQGPLKGPFFTIAGGSARVKLLPRVRARDAVSCVLSCCVVSIALAPRAAVSRPPATGGCPITSGCTTWRRKLQRSRFKVPALVFQSCLVSWQKAVETLTTSTTHSWRCGHSRMASCHSVCTLSLSTKARRPCGTPCVLGLRPASSPQQLQGSYLG